MGVKTALIALLTFTTILAVAFAIHPVLGVLVLIGLIGSLAK